MNNSIIALLFSLTFLLYGCGGGGGEDESEGPDVLPPSQVQVTPEPDGPSQTISVGNNNGEVVGISKADSEDVPLSNGQAEIGMVEDPQMMAAIDVNGAPVYLGVVSPENQQVQIDARTTVKALLLMVPELKSANEKNPQAFENAFNASTAVNNFESFIVANPDWSEGKADSVEALKSAATDVFLRVSATVQSSSQLANVSASSSGQFTRQNVVIDETGNSANKDYFYSLKKDDIQVSVFNERDDFFTVRIQNDKYTWLAVTAGRDPKTLVVEDPQKKYQMGTKTTMEFDIPKADLEAKAEYGIFIYGPSFDGVDSLGAGSKAYKLWIDATGATLFLEMLIPSLKLITGLKGGCFTEMYEAVGTVVLNNAVGNPQFLEFINTQKFGQASLIFLDGFIDEAVAAQGSEKCIRDVAVAFTKQWIKRLIPYIGQAALAIDIAENGVKFVNASLAISTSNSENVWLLDDVENEVDSEIEGIESLSASYIGAKPYELSPFLNIFEDFRSNYNGECDSSNPKNSDADETICAAHEFSGTDSYIVKLAFECKDSVSDSSIACVSIDYEFDTTILFGPEPGYEVGPVYTISDNSTSLSTSPYTIPINTVDEGTDEQSYEIFLMFDVPGEYEGSVRVRDANGTEKLFSYSLQIVVDVGECEEIWPGSYGNMGYGFYDVEGVGRVLNNLSFNKNENTCSYKVLHTSLGAINQGTQEASRAWAIGSGLSTIEHAFELLERYAEYSCNQWNGVQYDWYELCNDAQYKNIDPINNSIRVKDLSLVKTQYSEQLELWEPN